MRTFKEEILNCYASGMWADETIGSVDELGHYALSWIPEPEKQWEELRDYWNLEERDLSEYLDAGWYVILTTNEGFIVQLFFGPEEEARAVFNTIREEYEEYWRVDTED